VNARKRPLSITTRHFTVDPRHPDRAAIAACAALLKDGGIVAFPTETVYGLGADASNAKAVERIYEIKGRPGSKPLTLHISDRTMIALAGCPITDEARRLIDRFWPGPLTLIVRSKDSKNIGFRMPDHAVALRLIEAVRSPIVGPSANLSGQRPPVTPQEVMKVFNGVIDAVLDSGPTEIGVESTVVDITVTPPRIIREGAIKRSEVLETLRVA